MEDRGGANAFLADFVPRYNARFTQAAPDPTSAYRAWPTTLDPNAVFCFKYLRTVANDNTVTLGSHRVQILPGPRGRSYANARVEVQERLDGSLAVVYQRKPLPIHLLTELPDRSAPIVLRARNQARASMHPKLAHVETPRSDFLEGRRGLATPSRERKQRGEKDQASDHAVSLATRRPRAPRQPGKPAPDHPWKRYAAEGKRRKDLREAGVTFSLNP